MKNLWWAYTTCTVIPMQELRGEEGGGFIIHVGIILIRMSGSLSLFARQRNRLQITLIVQCIDLDSIYRYGMIWHELDL